MLALAGHPLGLKFRFLDPGADACAFPLGEPFVGGFDDTRLLDRLADGAHVVTYEFEYVCSPASSIYPSPRTSIRHLARCV